MYEFIHFCISLAFTWDQVLYIYSCTFGEKCLCVHTHMGATLELTRNIWIHLCFRATEQCAELFMNERKGKLVPSGFWNLHHIGLSTWCVFKSKAQINTLDILLKMKNRSDLKTPKTWLLRSPTTIDICVYWVGSRMRQNQVNVQLAVRWTRKCAETERGRGTENISRECKSVPSSGPHVWHLHEKSAH